MEKKRNSRPLIAHLSMFGACAIWGLMAPLGKDAMTHGLDGLTMVSMRVAGGMFLFWVTSLLMQLFKSRTPNTNNLSPVRALPDLSSTAQFRQRHGSGIID